MRNRLYYIVGSLFLSLVLLATQFGPVGAQGPATDTVITLAQLGENEVFLSGPFDTYTATFGLPANWKLTAGSQLDLNLMSSMNTIDPSAASAIYGGTLTVKFNRDTIAIVPINTIGDFDFSIPIPAFDLISPRADGQMELRFELDSGISCTTNQHMDVVIKPSSRVSFSYDETLPSTDLSSFPRPIYQGTIYPDNALIVVPDQPTASEIQSAATVAAGLASLTANKLNIDLSTVGSLTPEQQELNHIVFVGKVASLPILSELTLPLPAKNGEFALADVDNGVIQMVNSPWSSSNVVLVVSGNTDTGTVKSAQAVSTGIINANISPNLAVVENIQDLSVPTSLIAEQNLAGLGYEQVMLEGRGIDSTVFNVYIPPGTVLSSDAYFELTYGHSALLDFDTSGLVVLFNDQPIGSVRFTEETSKQAINQARVTIPPTLALPGNNILEVRSSLEPADNCTDPSLRGLWAVIWPESRLALPSGPMQGNTLSILDLGIYPAPIVFDSTLANTAFVVQKDDVQTWQSLMHVAGFLADRSNGSIYMPKVIFDNEISDAELAQYNLIVMGLPSKLSIMNELNDALPIPFDLGTNVAKKNYSQVTYLIPSDTPLGYVQLLQSPWNENNIVIVALGNTEQGVIKAASALFDPSLRGQLAGNFAAINGTQVQTVDTRLGLPVAETAVTPDVVDPLIPQPIQADLTPPVVSRPAWLLIAIQVIIGLILIIVLLIFWSQWRRSRIK